MTIVDRLYAVTTGPRRRRVLTPVGLFLAIVLLVMVVFGGLFTDRALGLQPLLPGALGASIGAALLVGGLMLWGWCLALFRGRGVPRPPHTVPSPAPV